MFKQKQAFTLVELIVVITILAILGTIAFISLQGYSKIARDSTRLSDLSAMKTSLELFHLDAGKYPTTTNGFIVTYSGAEIWTQGIFGETTFLNVTRLDKIPKDPLTELKYTYSTTINKQEYQLSGIMEGDDYVLNNILLSQTNAGDTIATAIVTGNYNNVMVKTLTGSNCVILSLPSITSSLSSTITQLETILTNTGLVYNGYNNLPSNYESSKFKVDGGFEFKSNQLVAYSDIGDCKALYDADNNTARVELITNLQTAYSGTIIANTDGISNITTVDITDPTAVNLLSATLVNNTLGGKIIKNNNVIVSNNYVSCNDILINDPAKLNNDGVYSVDLYQNGNNIDVYCDMTTDGGGWTLIANVNDTSTNNTITSPIVYPYGNVNDLDNTYILGHDNIILSGATILIKGSNDILDTCYIKGTNTPLYDNWTNYGHTSGADLSQIYDSPSDITRLSGCSTNAYTEDATEFIEIFFADIHGYNNDYGNTPAFFIGVFGNTDNAWGFGIGNNGFVGAVPQQFQVYGEWNGTGRADYTYKKTQLYIK